MPKINPVPLAAERRKEPQQSIGDYLHGVQKKQEEKFKKRVTEEEVKAKSLANQKHVQTKSAVMSEKLEREKLHEIFKVLDSDEDGLISADKVDIQRIEIDELVAFSIQLLDILTPLLKTVEDQVLTLGAEDFVVRAHEHYKTLTVFDKKAILDFKKRFRTKEQLEQPTFTVPRHGEP
jgi:hypothetical protein